MAAILFYKHILPKSLFLWNLPGKYIIRVFYHQAPSVTNSLQLIKYLCRIYHTFCDIYKTIKHQVYFDQYGIVDNQNKFWLRLNEQIHIMSSGTIIIDYNVDVHYDTPEQNQCNYT